MKAQEICLDSFEEMQEPNDTVEFTVEVRIPNEYGGYYLRTKRYKTPHEIYKKIQGLLNLTICQCGHEWKPQKWDEKCPECGDEEFNRYSLIDEYDSCCHYGDDADKEIAPKDWWLVGIPIWCEQGGNEGCGVNVAVQVQEPHTYQTKTIPVYRIKSFLGMPHCLDLVKRLLVITGQWEEYDLRLK